MNHLKEEEIRENLCDAGCTETEADEIIACIACNNLKSARTKIDSCRQKHLDAVHDSQKCIDRLDYLCYQLEQ